MKKTTKVVLSAVLTIAMCLSVIGGATFALFTSNVKTDIAVTSGTVAVDAAIIDLATSSMGVDQVAGKFANGGTAVYDETSKELKLTNITPGDKVTLGVKIDNNSNVAVLYRTLVDAVEDDGLFAGLKVTIGEGQNAFAFNGFYTTPWTMWPYSATAADMTETLAVTIELPAEAGDVYQTKSCKINVKVEATQGNAIDYDDAGNAITYGYLLTDETGAVVIQNATDAKIVAMLVNNGEDVSNLVATRSLSTLNITSGLTIKLADDIDFGGQPIIPIGTEEHPFVGTFDGNGYTISNFVVNADDGAGLFGYVGDDNAATPTTIQSVTIKDATINGNENVGGLIGYATNTTIANNTVENVDVTGTNAGGVVGSLGEGNKVEYNIVDEGNAIGSADETKNEIGSNPVLGDDTVAVGTADELIEALENKKDVVFTANIKIDPANMSNAYGKTGINVKYGQTIDGNGYTLDIKGAGGTWDTGINTTGGVIKNITVTGSFRGIFINHNVDKDNPHSETVVLENVTTTGTVYTISCDQGLKQNLVATNCKFYGWTSYAATLGTATFNDCTFGYGSGYQFMRPYAPTTFVGCEFEAGYEMDPRAKVTFVNSTFDGEAITADNVATLVTSNVANATVAPTVTTDAELADAIAAGNTTVVLAEGTYHAPASAKGKTLTLIGSGAATVIEVVPAGQGEANGQLDYNFDGSNITFNNLTIKTNNQTYAGYARLTGTYNDCTFENTYCLNRNSTFNNCTFNISGDQYNIWTWGAPEATFTGCTFNSDGKAILLYGTANTKLTLNDCVFNDKGGLSDKKAAVEIGNDYGKTYELIVNNTIVNGYEINDKGINTGTTLWGNKNSMSQEKLNVVVDGEDVY